jgi:ubiquinone/menaquinone biosynthesis C-methylase UbiE
MAEAGPVDSDSAGFDSADFDSAGFDSAGFDSAGFDSADFDKIGAGYSQIRRADPRLARAIAKALGPATTVLNVGAGAGSYEPDDRPVVAAEPSAVMLAQHGGRRRVQATAGSLPFAPASFDAAMATLTVHHWPDLRQGLAEMRRVARRQVVFTWDPDHERELWLHTEYIPAMAAFERSRFPALGQVVDLLEAHQVVPFAIPHDFTDGFQHAYWRRPEAFLDARRRAASSMFAIVPPATVEPALARLRSDLDSGAWAARHSDLIAAAAAAVDYGFRLVIGGEEAAHH